jgi:hypothetical protein
MSGILFLIFLHSVPRPISSIKIHAERQFSLLEVNSMKEDSNQSNEVLCLIFGQLSLAIRLFFPDVASTLS